jgi:Bacteriophage Mu Gp45 spike protein
MHRASPSNTSFRAFSGGGTRSAVDQIDDSKLMQEHSGNFMANETRQGVEAPQNYGFTSVVMPAIKDALGKITDSAEAMISFMGGNRSFPVAGVMDDRRHRMFGMQPGDVGMFRTALDQLQMHFTGDGGFFSGAQDKMVRMQLVAKQQQQSGGGAPGAGTRDASSGSGGAPGQQSSGQQKGQKPVYKNGQDSDFFIHINENGTTASGSNVFLRQGTSFGSSQSSGATGATGSNGFTPKSDNVKVHVADDGNVYLGGAKGTKGMAKVMLQGEQWSANVFALGGGGVEPPDLMRETLKARIDALELRVAALEARL